MSKLNNITESYVIDEKFQVPKSYNGRVNLDPKENGTPFFIQDNLQFFSSTLRFLKDKSIHLSLEH